MAGPVLISKGTVQSLVLFQGRHHEKRASTLACESSNMERSLLNSEVKKEKLATASHSPQATSNAIPMQNWVAMGLF